MSFIHHKAVNTKLGNLEDIPASSGLSPLTFEATDALLPPFRSHGQQLGELEKTGMLARQ